MGRTGLRVAAFLILVAGLLAGCHSSGISTKLPTVPSTGEPLSTPAASRVLADTDWALTLVKDQPLVPGTYISLEFEAGTFAGSAGCNRYGGEYVAMDDGSLSHPTIEVTAMLCTEPEGVMEQEKTYVDAFVSAVAYRLSEDRLELQDATRHTVLVYGQQPRSAMDPARLLGTAWRLVSLGGRAPLPDSAITLGFLDEKWLVGYGSCRGYVSAYQASGSDLGLLFTSMLGLDCLDGGRLLPQEGEYTTLLEWVCGYRLSNHQLELLTQRGESLLFEALPQEAQASLEGPVWSFVAFVEENRAKGLPVPLPQTTSAISGTEITIAFRDEVATGSAGCNTYQAAYVYDRAMVAFGPAVATEKSCLTPSGVMEQEQRYLRFLDYFTYQIVGDQLWLQTDDGNALVLTVRDPGTRPNPIPATIIEKGNQVVISRVGEAFFRDHFVFDPIGSSYNEPDPSCVQDPANCAPHLTKPHYWIAYVFKVPGQTGVEAGAGFVLDSSGNLIETGEMTGISDCLLDPQECVFIGEPAAISVARQAGLEPGLGEWRTHFHWYGGEFNTYVWTVDNTLTADQSTGQSSGRTALIDANSGNVLEIFDWQQVP